MSIVVGGYSTDFYRANYGKGSSDDSALKHATKDAKDLFSQVVQEFQEDNRLTAKELKEDKDWREMTDEEWDKILEGVDEYIDAYKERLRLMKEMQEEAAKKAALRADSDMKATAASSAALSVAANGLGATNEGVAKSMSEGDNSLVDSAKHEKNWTKNLNTSDQTVLRTAKEAQTMEKDVISKFEEVQLTGSTTVGISKKDTITECASMEENENQEKVWTITVFTETGIFSSKCQNGKIIERWELEYTNPNDAKKVQDFLDKLEKDTDLTFCGSKAFWEEFLKDERNN